MFGRILYIILCVFTLVSCASGEHDLAARKAKAETQTMELCAALEADASLDSIRMIAERDAEVLFYVFDARRMVYWSSNRLASGDVYLFSYDTWRELNFQNARTLVRWTKAGLYNVLTVLPLSYTPIEDYTDIATVASQTFAGTLLAAGVPAVSAAAMIHAGSIVLDSLPHGSFFHASGGAVSMPFGERLRLVPYDALVGLAATLAATVKYML